MRATSLLRQSASVLLATTLLWACTAREAPPDRAPELAAELREPPTDTLSLPDNDEREAFIAKHSGLRQLGTGVGTLLFPTEGAEVIDLLRSELPPEHPAHLSDDYGEDDRVLIRRRLPDEAGVSYFVVYTDGPSGDPGFYLIHPETGRRLNIILGEVLVIASSGELTAFQRYNASFTQIKRVVVDSGGFNEELPARFALDLRTIVLDSLRLQRSDTDDELVAWLVRGDSVVVREAREERGVALWIETASGVRGVALLPITQCPRAVVRGICSLGD